MSVPRRPGRNAQDLHELVSEVTKHDFGYVHLAEAAHPDSKRRNFPHLVLGKCWCFKDFSIVCEMGDVAVAVFGKYSPPHVADWDRVYSNSSSPVSGSVLLNTLSYCLPSSPLKLPLWKEEQISTISLVHGRRLFYIESRRC